jgi:hypothetical protein
MTKKIDFNTDFISPKMEKWAAFTLLESTVWYAKTFHEFWMSLYGPGFNQFRGDKISGT